MGEPQQPEIARSRRSAVSDSAAKAKATTSPVLPGDTVAPVPEANQPGHHPEVEQDKPTGPPPTPRRRAKTPTKASSTPRRHRSELRWDEPFKTASRLFGVTERNGYVEATDDQLEIRFGPWHLTTSMTNVEHADVTGGFQWWRVIGPARLSLNDRGVTFATTNRQAVCIKFREPVPGIEPAGVIRHPGATVTVKDPDELARFINGSKAVRASAA